MVPAKVSQKCVYFVIVHEFQPQVTPVASFELEKGKIPVWPQQLQLNRKS